MIRRNVTGDSEREREEGDINWLVYCDVGGRERSVSPSTFGRGVGWLRAVRVAGVIWRTTCRSKSPPRPSAAPHYSAALFTVAFLPSAPLFLELPLDRSRGPIAIGIHPFPRGGERIGDRIRGKFYSSTFTRVTRQSRGSNLPRRVSSVSFRDFNVRSLSLSLSLPSFEGTRYSR